MTEINVEIAETLERIQVINPDLYGYWYSKLYPPFGDNKLWNKETLTHLDNFVKRYNA